MANNITLKVMANLALNKKETAVPKENTLPICRLSLHEIELLKEKIHSAGEKGPVKKYNTMPEKTGRRYGITLNELAESTAE